MKYLLVAALLLLAGCRDPALTITGWEVRRAVAYCEHKGGVYSVAKEYAGTLYGSVRCNDGDVHIFKSNL